MADATTSLETTAEAAISPFSGTSVTDANASATDTLTVTLSGGGGTLSGTGLSANPDGSYTLAAADPATLTTELQALVFTPTLPSSGAPSATTLTLADQSSAGTKASGISVTITDTPARPTPAQVMMSGVPANAATTAEKPVSPFAGATIADGNAGATDKVTITVSGAGGALSDSGLSRNPDGTYTLAAADPATITAELRALVFTPAAPAPGATATSTLTLADQSSAGTSATGVSTVITDTPAKLEPTAVVMAGLQAAQATTAEAPITPFSGASIADANVGATDTVTITLSGEGGVLAGAGLTANPDGTYKLAAADPATVTAELQALVFTPATPTAGTSSATTLTLADQSSAGTSATGVSTVVADTPAKLEPTAVVMAGLQAAQATMAEAPITPFSGASIADANVGATDTVTITLSGEGGVLAGAGMTANPDGTYTLAAADPATVTAELQALVFTPAMPTAGGPSETALTLADQSSAGTGANDVSTVVTDTPANDSIAEGGSGNAPSVGGGTSPSGPTPPYRPTANYLPASGSETDLTQASGLTIGDFWDSRNGETILWSSTGGSDTVQLHDFDAPERSMLDLGDLTRADVSLARVGNDLDVIDRASGATLTVTDQFAGNNSGVASLAFAHGVLLTRNLVVPYRPTADFLPAGNSETDLTHASGLTIGDFWDSRNDETILWSSAGGSDSVQLHDFDAPERSILDLGDLSQADVTLTRVGNDLDVIDRASGATLTVTDQFAGNNSGVASLVFANASVQADTLVVPYRPTANLLPAGGSETDLTHASGLTIGDFWDSRNDETILWSSTGGSDSVELHDFDAPERSVLDLGDLTRADVSLTRVGNDLDVIDRASGATLTVTDQFADNNSGVASIIFAGATLQADSLDVPYRPTANFVPASGSETDLTQASGLTIGDFWDSRNDETVLWSSTGGSDSLQLHDFDTSERSVLDLGDLTQAAVTLTRVGNDLDVIDKASGATLTVTDQFAGNNSGVASIVFADATVLAAALAVPYRPVADFLPASGSETDLTQASGLTVGDFWDSRNDETILWSSTGGSDSVQLHDFDAPERSMLDLGDLIRADVTLTRVGNDLDVIDRASGATLTVTDQFAGNNSGVASLAFAHGVLLTAGLVVPYRPTADFLPAGNSETDLTHASGLTIGDFWDSRNDETILWSSIGGSDSVQLHDFDAPERSILDLGDLTQADVTLTRVGNDLDVIDRASGATLTVTDQFASNNSGVASLVFADASVQADTLVVPYRPTANFVPASGSETDLTHASGLTIGDFWDSRNDETILWSSTGGSNAVELHDFDAPERSMLNLSDLTRADVSLTRVGNDLDVIDRASGAALTVTDQFANNNSGVASINFCDGTMLDHDQILSASQAPTVVIGTGQNDVIAAPQTNATLIAGQGSDTFDLSGTGSDTIAFSKGDGHDTIDNPGWGYTRSDVLDLTNILSTDVSLARNGNAMTLTVNPTGDTVTVPWQFYSNDYGLGTIAFADGTTWNRAHMLATT